MSRGGHPKCHGSPDLGVSTTPLMLQGRGSSSHPWPTTLLSLLYPLNHLQPSVLHQLLPDAPPHPLTRSALSCASFSCRSRGAPAWRSPLCGPCASGACPWASSAQNRIHESLSAGAGSRQRLRGEHGVQEAHASSLSLPPSFCLGITQVLVSLCQCLA